MADNTRDREHAAVDELLPWYINGTLSAVEHAKVRRHLDACKPCRDNASLLSHVSAVVNRPAATPIPPPRRSDALLATIDRSLSAGSRQWRSPALAAAASLAIAAAAALLLWPDREAGVPEPSVYETVTSTQQQTAMDYVMNLVFEPGVGPEEEQRVLRELEAGVIRRDEASRAYQVNVTLGATSLDELIRFTAAVEARPEVRSARIIALQLPMQQEPGEGGR